VLLPIAKVFGVKVEDLFADKKITSSRILSKEETTLYLDITAYLNDKIIAHNIEVHYQDFTSTINEIYDYFESNKDYNMDTKFVNWFIKQKFNLD
jgi:hypothetical protein